MYVTRILLVFIVIVIMGRSTAEAQATGSVQGKVADKTGPLEFATVSLFARADTLQPLRSNTTDSSGRFKLDRLPMGEYLLTLRLIGYNPVRQYVVLSQSSPGYNAGTVILSPSGNLLTAVTVSGTRSVIQKTNNGIVVNAGSTLTQAGGSATDLLRNTPTVAVDEDGNITLRGKTPLVLINGRNSAIASTDQIAASSIDRIEIINNPSAQYDASTEAGIINIVLKKNKQNGTNGALAIGSGFGAKARFNSSAMFSYKNNQWNVSLGYDNRFAGRTRTITANRISLDNPDEYYLNQYRNDRRLDQVQNLRLNIGFNPDARNSFELEANGVLDYQDNHEDLHSLTSTDQKVFVSNVDRFSDEYERGREAELAFNYSRKFSDKRKSLTATVSSAFEPNGQNTGIHFTPYDENDAPLSATQYQQTNNKENNNVTNIKLDFAQPLSARAVLQTGYKATLRSLDANFQLLDEKEGTYVPNPEASSNFIFHEKVHALYLLYNATMGKKNRPWNYELGVRAEQTYNDGLVKNTQQQFSHQYLQLFPSASLVYNVSASELWRINYGRKINRPGFGQLNPFIDVTDSLNQHGGNPNLQPELVNSFELGYNKDWSRYSVYAVLYYRHANNSIRSYSILQPSGVALSQPQNFGELITYGIENIFTAKPVNRYDVNLSLSLYSQQIKGSPAGQGVDNTVVSWYTKLINNIVPWNGARLQVTGSYNSPVALPQGRRIANYTVDMGFQQKLGKKGNARLGLVITDLFKTQRYGTELSAYNFISNRYGTVDSRAVLLTFAFTFGTSFKEKLLENKFSND